MIHCKETLKGLSFHVYVQPRASKTAIAGIHQDALKIKLTAPPAGGAANKQCIQLLAKALAIPKSAMTITHGQTSRKKTIRIACSNDMGRMDPRVIRHKLQGLIEK